MSVRSSTSQRFVQSSRTNSFTTTDSTRDSFQRPESPTLPEESGHININTSNNEINSVRSSTYSGQVPTSPTLHTDKAHERMELERNQYHRFSSRSHQPKQQKAPKPTKSRKPSHHPPHQQQQQQKISDHLAAAIELSTTNAATSSAPAAGMYWSRCLTYGRGPSRPLRAHTANLIGEKLYVFGGCDTSQCFNTLYILDMDTMTWSRPRISSQYSPPPCRAHSCTVMERDIGVGRKSYQLYIFGGGNGPEYFNDVYVFDVDSLTWSKPNIDPSTKPPKRRAHASCLWNDKLIVIGGGDGACALDDVYMLDISNQNDEQLKWELMQTGGNAPPARGYHTCNLVKDKLVMFGGSDGHDCFEDVYVLDLESKQWTHIDLDRKVPRLAHTSTQVGSYVFIIGGHDGRRYSQDVLLFNLVTMSWEVRKIYGAPPNPRGYHTTILYDSRLYVIGGYDGKNVFDDVYMLELSACAYLPQITNFEIDI